MLSGRGIDVIVDIVAGIAIVTLAALVVRLTRRTDALRTRVERLRVRLGWAESQALQMRKRWAESQVRAANAAAGRTPAIEVAAMSQYGEDALLWALLGDRVERGVFVEAGAYDGRQLSVTWLLESAGWRGLLVEPIPSRAEACRRNRPGSHVVNTALGDPGGPETLAFSVVSGSDDGLGMLSSVEGLAGHDEKVALQAGARTERITVPVATLDSALGKASGTLGGFERVDALVLDVEGFEATALRGFDLARWRPRVIVIEDNTMGRERDASGIIESAGYTQAGWIGVNRVYVAPDEHEVRARARAWSDPLDWPNLTVAGM